MLITVFFSLVVINAPSVFGDLDIFHSNKNSDDYVPCEKGWLYFRDRCYKGEEGWGKGNTWTKALARCRTYGADLVSIQSEEEQDFINAFLILENEYISWIGLNDRDNESDYRWSDGSVFNYTNWNHDQPTGLENEECVHMYRNPIGKWNDESCEKTSDHICEMKADTQKSSPNLIYCPLEEGGGLKFNSSCYHFVPEVQSWSNAESYCKNNHNGHLLALQDSKEDKFLEHIISDSGKEIWIGIKLQDHLQQKWSAGWFVLNEKVNEKERYVKDTCVALKNAKEWVKLPCSTQLPFICEVSKAKAPILKSPPAGSYCPKAFNDWRDFGGDYCYYIKTKTKISFSDAKSHCQARGGNLASIHSQEEADILHQFIRNSGYSVYIGLVRINETNGEIFGWTDGSTLDYKNWEHDEPNRIEEECVEALTASMKWRDTSCSSEQSGYICSVKKIMPAPNIAEDPAKSSSHAIFKSSIGICVYICLVMSFLGVMM